MSSSESADEDRQDASATPEPTDMNQRDVVDPEVRGVIYALCTALGGMSVEQEGVYTLGDEALACLKDLRRWLKLHDEKFNRYDVARCLAEANLVQGDLLEIIAAWKEDPADKYYHRIVLACLELLAPLTWPLDKTNSEMTRNHHRHMPYLRVAQAQYKQAILHHRSGKILKNIVRMVLPSMAEPAADRSERDEAIIRLVLYTIRNLAIIEHPSPNEMDTGEDIARSATIAAFQEQNIFDLLLTVASGIGDEFNTQDVVVLEVLYHLVKGVDVDALFLSEKEEMKKKAQDLTSLLKAEDQMKRAGARAQPTRHNRFGTTVWLERDDGRRAFVPGQKALVGKGTGLQKLDSTKKWNKPRGADRKGVSLRTEFDMTVWLEAPAKRQLREFVENFLDAGFNPLFNALRRAIERDADRLLNTHSKQFFYLAAWFLKAERVRRLNAKKKGHPSSEDDGFGLVATVLNGETLIILNRKMSEWYDLKQTRELQAAMRCLTQILYTIQDMAASPIEEDQDVAENMQSRLFYEETTMDLLVAVLKSYTKEPFSWLDDCTELVHMHLKMLEKYSEQHEMMFVRARRRKAKVTKQQQSSSAQDADDANFVVDQEDPENETAEASKAAHARAVRERKFEFSKYEHKFTTQPCINTWLAFLAYYLELSTAQLMRGIKYLHRIFEKRHEEVILYRIDIVDLFYRMMQGEAGTGDGALPRSHGAYGQADTFFRRYFRHLTRKLEKQPELYVELLFTKMPNTVHFLQNGEDAASGATRTPRPAVDLEVRPGMSKPEQVGVAVSALIDDTKSDAVEWLKSVLTRAVAERKSWEAASVSAQLAALERGEDAPLEDPKPPAITLEPDSDARKKALFRDGKLRLLLRLCGAEPLDAAETPDTAWALPSALAGDELAENLALLKKHADDPPTFEDAAPADLLRRKPRRRVVESDSDGDDDFINDHGFEVGGPTPRRPDREERPKTRRRRRRRIDEDVGPDDSTLNDRARKKRERERILHAKIKSALRITDSDNDSEEERRFFEKERLLRLEAPTRMDVPPEMLAGVRKDGVEAWTVDNNEEDGDVDVDADTDADGLEMDEEDGPADPTPSRKRRKSTAPAGSDESSGSDSDPAAIAARRAARLAEKPRKKKPKQTPAKKKTTPAKKKTTPAKKKTPAKTAPVKPRKASPLAVDSDSEGETPAAADEESSEGTVGRGSQEHANADGDGDGDISMLLGDDVDDDGGEDFVPATARTRRGRKVVDDEDEDE